MRVCSMRKLDYAGAIREATAQEMERDPRVFVYGIGVPTWSSIFGTTKGLPEKFGKERCFDTPLSEDGIVGTAIGMALNGLKPVAEIGRASCRERVWIPV